MVASWPPCQSGKHDTSRMIRRALLSAESCCECRLESARYLILLELANDQRAAVLARPARKVEWSPRHRHFEVTVLDYKNRFRSLAHVRQHKGRG